MNKINYQDFLKLDIRVGTVLTAEENNNLKIPSIILKIDFGTKIGIKKSSAQLKENYKSENLIDRQILAITNFPIKQIGNFFSEVLVLGLPDQNNNPILISPDFKIENGNKLY